VVSVWFKVGVSGWCASALVATVLAVAGCGAAAPAAFPPMRGVAGYWDRSRLLGARPFRFGGEDLPQPGATADSRTADTREGLRVGALFEHGATGNHFCTASVVSSPEEDLLITAAHCINSGKGSGAYNSDIVFIPDYRDGQEPYGVWTPAKLLVAPQWASSSNPDYDVGFVILEPHDGENIEQVLGADHIGDDLSDQYLVHVTGYPDSGNTPITCVNFTSGFSSTQLRWACTGYSGGTSGSPWVTRFNDGSHTGTIVGVIGGYEQGGDTPSVSYSVRFGPAVLALYQQAVADEPAAAEK
jgi:V8-like Glu-specific endopeptidase